jgi:antitoxin (DNA-binding transcriptional repressor) of toxin-antitoxin stability system
MNGSRKHFECGPQPENRTRTRTVSTQDLQLHCREILKEVNSGQLELLITDGGVTVAKLSPAKAARSSESRPNAIRVSDDRRIAAAGMVAKMSVDDLRSP